MVTVEFFSSFFLMGLSPDVCLAVSEGLSVLCALITHSRLRSAAAALGGFVQEGYKGDKEEDFFERHRAVISQSEPPAWIAKVYDLIFLNLVKY